MYSSSMRVCWLDAAAWPELAGRLRGERLARYEFLMIDVRGSRLLVDPELHPGECALLCSALLAPETMPACSACGVDIAAWVWCTYDRGSHRLFGANVTSSYS